MEKYLYILRKGGKPIDKVAALSSANAANYFTLKHGVVIKHGDNFLNVGVANRGFRNPCVEYDYPEYCVKGNSKLTAIINKSLVMRTVIENMPEDKQIIRRARRKTKYEF